MDNQCSTHLDFIPQSEMEQDVLSKAMEPAENADFAVVLLATRHFGKQEARPLVYEADRRQLTRQPQRLDFRC